MTDYPIRRNAFSTKGRLAVSLLFVSLLLGYLLLPAFGVLPAAKAQGACPSGTVITTNTWATYYSTNTLLYSQPVTVGSVIVACDPDGEKVGATQVITAGWYLMSVYGNGSSSSHGVGNEATIGDLITFYINGMKALPAGPDNPAWPGLSAVPVHLDLVAPISAEVYLPLIVRSAPAQ